MLLCKTKKVIRTKGTPFPESKLSSASAIENFHQLCSKHRFFSYSFSLKLSLVFICRENSRLSEILLFPDCPRFCRLMKTQNRKYPRSPGESGAFLFSRRVPDFCDGRRPFPTNGNPNLYRRGRWRWISLITNPLNCWAPVPLSKLDMASLENTSENLGQTPGGYPIYR